MTVRYYLVPDLVSGSTRVPKYFATRLNPSGIKCSAGVMDYGGTGYYMVCANISDTDHTFLVSQADVLSVPLDIDVNLNSAGVTAAKDFLENINLPGTWISTTDTYRGVLRSLVGIFKIFQRSVFLTGQNVNWGVINLNTQWQNIPVIWQNAVIQAATEKGIDTSQLTPTTQLRTIMIYLANHINEPVDFGFAVL